MEKASLPRDFELIREWLEATRFQSISAHHEETLWKEWWTLLEFYRRRRLLCGRATEMVVQHLGDAKGAPDFRIEDDGTEMTVAITEATAWEDRRAIKLHRSSEGLHMLGDPASGPDGQVSGGRFRGGATGDAPEADYVRDILDAIAKKATKPYAPGTRLIIYPKSNASCLANQFRAFQMLEERRPAHPFAQVVILWLGGGLAMLGQEDICYVSVDNPCA